PIFLKEFFMYVRAGFPTAPAAKNVPIQAAAAAGLPGRRTASPCGRSAALTWAYSAAAGAAFACKEAWRRRDVFAKGWYF
ncbi:hypothetical protein P4H70_31875, partial [Paenibacillus ehimensis]|uniref:hypothetical protein n=1 Tax=Paenibacillus ehimensis TaxID=79264 RepID=UPI002DB886D5